MPIQGTTRDYSNRQIDLELLQSIRYPESVQGVSISVVTSPPKMVTGIQKAVQRYAALFLTNRGDNAYDIAQGTDFVANVVRGAVQDNAGLNAAFATANDEVLRQLQDADADTTLGTIPDDERIVAASLINFDVDYGTATVYLRVQLTTAAGANVVFVIPATTT